MSILKESEFIIINAKRLLYKWTKFSNIHILFENINSYSIVMNNITIVPIEVSEDEDVCS